jgi:hypothetical protein
MTKAARRGAGPATSGKVRRSSIGLTLLAIAHHRSAAYRAGQAYERIQLGMSFRDVNEILRAWGADTKEEPSLICDMHFFDRRWALLLAWDDHDDVEKTARIAGKDLLDFDRTSRPFAIVKHQRAH